MPQDLIEDLFRQWLGAGRHHDITWANVDKDSGLQMTSLGLIELKPFLTVQQLDHSRQT